MSSLPAKIRLFAAILLISAAACSLPAPATPTPLDAEAAYTAAAETIIAQLTQVAQTLTPSQAPGGETPGAPETTAPPGDTATLSPTLTEALPTPTETLTPSPSPSPSPTFTPTLPSTDPRASLGAPTLLDTFNNDALWALYEDDHVSFEIDDSRLTMTAFNPEFWEGFMLAPPDIGDFYLEMTATTRNCSGGDRYGLMARSSRVGQEPYRGYNFSFTCDGRFSLRVWDGKQFTSVTEWTASDAIRSGSNATNRLGIWMEGERIVMYANGNLLKEVNDDTYQVGKFGVVIGSANTSNFTVDVDEIAYWDLP